MAAAKSSLSAQDVLLDISAQYSDEANHRMVLEQLSEFCQSLAFDLNSTRVHFVNELVQNADDNTYAAGVKPTLSIKVDSHGVTSINNEVGFAEKNVRAICATRMSSKSKAAGHTGEKGIGFKSVFAVADKVYIHSNDYCFMFNSQAKLGYLRPIPVKPCEFPVPVAPQGTTMYLSFKPGFDHKQLLAEMASLRPDFMVFLNQLRCLELVLPHTPLTYSVRSEAGSDIVALEAHSSTGTAQPPSLFLMVSERVMVPSEAEDGKRAGLTSTTVSVAFPLDANQYAAPRTDAQAFATLPIGPSGLKFLIQANFVVSINRESILQDRPWNLFLRDQLTHLLLNKAMDILKQHPHLRYNFLAYMPLPGEVSPSSFYGPLANQLMKGLASTACMLTASHTWAIPSAVVLSNPQWELAPGIPLINNAMLQSLHGSVQYCSAALLRCTESDRVVTVLQQLGGRQFGGAELAACLLSHAAGSVLVKQPHVWPLNLYKRLAAHDATGSDEVGWASLAASAPIFRVQGSSAMTTASGLMVWDASTFTAEERGLFTRLRFLADGTHSSAVMHVLNQRFGIHRATASMLGEHLLSLYPDAVESCSDQRLQQHVEFLHRHNCRLQHKDERRLQLRQACLCVRTCQCRIYTDATSLCLPLAVAAQPFMRDLPRLHFLHSSYFTNLPAEQAASLQLYMCQLGVKALSLDAVCNGLLDLYRLHPRPSADRHLQHLQFFQQHIGELSNQTRQLLRLLPLVTHASKYYEAGKNVFFPLHEPERALVSADLTESAQLLFCRAAVYQAIWTAEPMMRSFMQQHIGVQVSTPLHILQALVRLHGMPGACSKLSSTQLDNHLRYALRHHKPLLQSEAGRAASRQLLVRTAGGGQPQPSAHPVFLPLDAQFADVEGDLREAGMTFVHPEAHSLLGGIAAMDVEALLGIKAPEARDVIDKLITLYSQGPDVVCATRSRPHLLMLLRFLFQHARIILSDKQLLKRAAEHVFIRIADGGDDNATGASAACYAVGSQRELLVLPVFGAPAAVQQWLRLAGVKAVDAENLNLGTANDDSSSSSPAASEAFLTQVLGVQRLPQARIATLYLRQCVTAPTALQQALSDQHMLEMARFVVSALGTSSNRDRLSGRLMVRVSGLNGNERQYKVPAETYLPSTGRGWSLQQVLLDGAAYLHPAWVAGAPELCHWVERAPAPVVMGDSWTLGPDLERIIAVNNVDRNMALLCMIRDMLDSSAAGSNTPSSAHSSTATARWRSMFAAGTASSALCAKLGRLMVRISGGSTRLLCDCFLRNASLLMLLGPTAPFIDVPDPDHSSWEFLMHLGTSAKVDPKMLIMRLKQLQATGRVVDLTQVTTLYQHLGALATSTPEFRTEVLNTFQPLSNDFVYLPPNCLNSEHTSRAQWLSSSDSTLRWSSRVSCRVLPGKALLSKIYPGCAKLFKEVLQVPDMQDHDLPDCLCWLFKQPSVSASDEAQVLEIYKALAGWLDRSKQAATPAIQKLLSKAVVLVSTTVETSKLTSDGQIVITPTRHLRFVKCASTVVYLADDPVLVDLFQAARGLQLLAVPAIELPVLRPLLQLCKDPLRSLSAAVTCTIQRGHVGGDKEWMEMSNLLQCAAGWVARAAYHLDPARFAPARLSEGRLTRLCSKAMSVHEAQDITQTFSLLRGATPDVRSRPAAVAVEDTPESIQLFVDRTLVCDDDELLEALARCYAGLWLESHLALTPLVDKLFSMLKQGRSPESMDRWLMAHHMLPLPADVHAALGLDTPAMPSSEESMMQQHQSDADVSQPSQQLNAGLECTQPDTAASLPIQPTTATRSTQLPMGASQPIQPPTAAGLLSLPNEPSASSSQLDHWLSAQAVPASNIPTAFKQLSTVVVPLSMATGVVSPLQPPGTATLASSTDSSDTKPISTATQLLPAATLPTQPLAAASLPAQPPPATSPLAKPPTAASLPAQPPTAASPLAKPPTAASLLAQPPTAASLLAQPPTAASLPAQPPTAASLPAQPPTAASLPAQLRTAASILAQSPTAASPPAQPTPAASPQAQSSAATSLPAQPHTVVSSLAQPPAAESLPAQPPTAAQPLAAVSLPTQPPTHIPVQGGIPPSANAQHSQHTSPSRPVAQPATAVKLPGSLKGPFFMKAEKDDLGNEPDQQCGMLLTDLPHALERIEPERGLPVQPTDFEGKTALPPATDINRQRQQPLIQGSQVPSSSSTSSQPRRVLGWAAGLFGWARAGSKEHADSRDHGSAAAQPVASPAAAHNSTAGVDGSAACTFWCTTGSCELDDAAGFNTDLSWTLGLNQDHQTLAPSVPDQATAELSGQHSAIKKETTERVLLTDVDWSAASSMTLPQLHQLAACSASNPHTAISGIGSHLRPVVGLPMCNPAGPASACPPLAPDSVLPEAAGAGSNSARVQLVGELCVLRSFMALFPGQFDDRNWVSATYHSALGLPRRTSQPAFDFWMRDVEGELTGVPSSLALIGVSSTPGDTDHAPSLSLRPGHMSLALLLAHTSLRLPQAEAEVAGLPQLAGLQVVYVFVRVAGAHKPTITHVLRHPGSMLMKESTALNVTGERVEVQGGDGMA